MAHEGLFYLQIKDHSWGQLLLWHSTWRSYFKSLSVFPFQNLVSFIKHCLPWSSSFQLGFVLLWMWLFLSFSPSGSLKIYFILILFKASPCKWKFQVQNVCIMNTLHICLFIENNEVYTQSFKKILILAGNI